MQSAMSSLWLRALVFLSLIAVSFQLSCYQQPYTPGQQQVLQTSNWRDLPNAVCVGSSTACFKFVCFGTTYYTVRGCLDTTGQQPQSNCQTLTGQCPNAQGTCYTCNGNNCNSAPALRSMSTASALVAGFLALMTVAFTGML